MYKYVKDKFDHTYSYSLPQGIDLTEHDVPLEEIEIREMVAAWNVSGYVPIFGSDEMFERYVCSHSMIAVKGDWHSKPEKQKAARLERLEKTFITVCHHRVYFAALARLVSSLPDSAVKQRIKQLKQQPQAARTTFRE